jgi:hypothetical protein
MRMTTIKRNIARIVAASMALAILAPAAPTYAADGTAAINFDLDTLSSGVGRINGWTTKDGTSNVKQDGTSGGTTSFNTTLDTLNTGDEVNKTNGADSSSKLSTYQDGTSTRINLPWWDGQTKKASPSTAENTPYGKWNFDGYKLKGWYDNQALSSSQLPNNYLYTVSGKASQAKTYYAVFEADESKTFKETVKHEGLPSVFTSVNTDNEKSKKVLEAVTIEAKTISGYTATKMSGGLYEKDKGSSTGQTTDIKAEASRTYTAGTDGSTGSWSGWTATGGSEDIAKKYGFSLDYDTGRFSGKMVNKDLEATITYAPDPTNPMTVTVVHHIVNSDGTASGTPDKVERYSFTVEEDFSGKVAPLSAYIQTQTGESVPMYLLVGSKKSDGSEVTAGSESKKPTLRKAGGTSFDDETTSHKNNLLLPDDKTNDSTTQYITNVTKKTETSGSTTTNTYEITESNSSFALTGKMINQSIQVDYYYIPNPEYTGRIIVNYVDETGTDITDKVIAELKADGTTIDDTANTTNWYVVTTTDGKSTKLVKQLEGSKTAEIKVPEMAGYTITGEYTPDTVKANEKAEIWVNGGSLAEWDSSKKSFTVTMSSTPYSGEITVKIFRDQDALIDIGNHIETEDGVKDINHTKELVIDGEGYVTLKESDLPNIETDTGYTADGWYYRTYKDNKQTGSYTDTKIEFDSTGSYRLAVNSTKDTSGTATFKLIAKATANTDQWITYNFNYGNYHSGFDLFADGSEVSTSGTSIQVLAVESDGKTKRTGYTWTNLKAETAFPQAELSQNLKDLGYKVVWRPEHESSVDMSTVTEDLFDKYPSGTTFLAYYESTTAAAVDTIDAKPSLQTYDGYANPTIQITSALNPSPQISYVVTDSEGTVVGVFGYSELYDYEADDIRAINSQLSGLGELRPGQSYKLYQAMTEKIVGLGVGASFPTTDLVADTDYSTATEVYIPEALEPRVIEDSENPGKVAIVVDPVTKGYQYALKNASKEVVYGYTSIDEYGQVTFRDLDADSTYYVFVSPDGSDMAGQKGLEVHTDELSASATAFSLQVVAPVKATITIGGIPTEDVNSVEQIEPGTRVSVKLPTLSGTDSITAYNYIGISESDVTRLGSTIHFTMPSKNVKIQVIYGDPNNKVTWATASYANIEYTYPDGITEKGLYKVVIEKTSPITGAIASTLRAQDEDLELADSKSFTLIAYIQKNTQDDGSGTWQNYKGKVDDFTLTVTTGGMQSDRRGRVYRLGEMTIPDGTTKPVIATDSNATEDTAISDYFKVDNIAKYQGSFDITVSNGEAFAYSYIKEPTVTITDLHPDVDSRKDRQFLTVHEGQSLAQAIKDQGKSVWASNTTWPDPDTGITYSYAGLYEDRDGQTKFNEFETVQESIGLYMYFSDDSKERADVLEDLENAISTGNVLLRNNMAKYATKLQLAIDAATLVLEQTSPKATTTQLKAALEGIQAYIDTKGSSGGGGSSSGGGGSSTRKDTTTTTDPETPVVPSPDKIIIPSTNVVEGGDITLFKNFYEVGVDGNWEQLDTTGENWKFHLTGGTYVTGSWALIRATYNGQKVDYFYHFDANGLMDRGWLLESTDGHWYYLSEDQSDILGHMFTGWVYNKDDGRWYYLDTKGDMVLGWKQISGKWYYFAPSSPIQTWSYNTLTRKWYYNNIENDRPMGSLYINESTPDGYSVDTSGALRVVNPS